VIRRLFTAASALSLLIAILSLIFWLRSSTHAFAMSDVTAWDAQGNRVPIGSGEGSGFQQIQTMGGWRRAGFAYWAGPSESPVLRGDQDVASVSRLTLRNGPSS
jgi:hypothetical protein